MPLCSISLPDFSIAHKLEHTTLTATGALEIDIPADCGTARTSIELEDLILRTRLWIARTGSCYFNIDISVNGHRVTGPDQLERIRDMMLTFEVGTVPKYYPSICGGTNQMQLWERLGLRLLYIDSSSEYPNRICFSIQHPDLSSALVPDTTRLARFHAVSYSIDLGHVEEKGHRGKRRATRTKNPKNTALVNSRTGNVMRGHGDVDYNCLTEDDQRALDEFTANLNLDKNLPAEPRRLKRRRSRTVIASELLDATYTKDILEACLENIMVGIRRCPRHLKFTHRSPGKALSELVPGVFNMPYLKVRPLTNCPETMLTIS